MYECPACGRKYSEPTVCAGSPVVDGAVTDYSKPVHDPAGAGLVKQEFQTPGTRPGEVIVTEEWVLESEAETPVEDAAEVGV